MNKLIAVTFAAALLANTSSQANEDLRKDHSGRFSGDYGIDTQIITDTLTGCSYLIVRTTGNITVTPLLSAEGDPICGIRQN